MPRPAGPGAKQLLSVGEIRKDQGMEGWGNISFEASLGYKTKHTKLERKTQDQGLQRAWQETGCGTVVTCRVLGLLETPD